MMSKIRMMTPTHGDKILAEYDSKQVAEGERIFNEQMYGIAKVGEVLPAPRYLAFVNHGKGDQRMIRRFDPTAEDIVIMPGIAGG